MKSVYKFELAAACKGGATPATLATSEKRHREIAIYI
jgi:hypothetical protein